MLDLRMRKIVTTEPSLTDTPEARGTPFAGHSDIRTTLERICPPKCGWGCCTLCCCAWASSTSETRFS